MPRLIRIDSGDEIGTITDAQLKFLTDLRETEDDEDHCVIDQNTLELLSDNNADTDLIALLEKTLADDDSVDIAWE